MIQRGKEYSFLRRENIRLCLDFLSDVGAGICQCLSYKEEGKSKGKRQKLKGQNLFKNSEMTLLPNPTFAF
jgi:hypothetical protein